MCVLLSVWWRQSSSLRSAVVGEVPECWWTSELCGKRTWGSLLYLLICVGNSSAREAEALIVLYCGLMDVRGEEQRLQCYGCICVVDVIQR